MTLSAQHRIPPACAAALLVVALLAAAPACKRDAPAPEAPAANAAKTPTPSATPAAQAAGGTSDTTKPAAAKPPKGPPPEDPRTPADFATAWARIVEDVPREQHGAATRALRRDWTKRVYTWTGYALANTCLAAKRTCNLQTFDFKNTPKRKHIGGAFPRVTFTPDAWKRIETGCKGQPQCVVTFKALLDQATADTSLPLALIFKDADVLDTRQPKPDEVWFRPPIKRPENARTYTHRTGRATPIKRALIKPRVF